MKNTFPSVRAGVVGANGYSGTELCRLLLAHPQISLSACFTRDAAWTVADVLPMDRRMQAPEYFLLEELESHVQDLDLLFLATPADVSLSLVKKVLATKSSLKVVDLSGALRLTAHGAGQIYGVDTSDIPIATYGLQPWNRLESNLIANPGCYATSVLMALLPLLKNALIDPSRLVIDAKSGVTGAGKSAKAHLQFPEVAESCVPYRVGEHQHMPEIQKIVKDTLDVEINPHFCTHLLPIRRGIVSTIYAELRNDVSADSVAASYSDVYKEYPFFRAVESGSKSELLLKNLVGTPMTQVSFKVCGRKLYVQSMIDNLMKGAASQAIENANLLFSFSMDAGLNQQWGLS